jgi:Reverse transcriptase (RNA-dependent DNA polymerase)
MYWKSLLLVKVLNVLIVSAVFKIAQISPRMKKIDLDSSDRPISSLSVLFKLLERLVAQQLKAHLDCSGHFPQLQCAYWAKHSIETAVLSGILLATDDGDLSALAMLDLSAAFNTVDHEILLRRLDLSYDLSGTPLHWFEPYLVGQSQQLRIGSTSLLSTVICGVPVGSVLGPMLFLLYSAGLLWLGERFNHQSHLYVDDTQIYGFCAPSETQALQNRHSACVDRVAEWMRSNRLQFNSLKTEVLWAATSRRLHQLPQSPLRVDTDLVTSTAVVRNLGLSIDADVSIRTHVMRTVSSCFAVMRQLRSIRRSVSTTVLQSQISSLVLCRLGYEIAALAGIPGRLTRRFQSVMNAAARMIYSTSRYEHISLLLSQLHWLKARERIDLKLAVIVFKYLNGTAPAYVADDLSRPDWSFVEPCYQRMVVEQFRSLVHVSRIVFHIMSLSSVNDSTFLKPVLRHF